MKASTTNFTTFSKIIDGVEITFISQYYGRTSETRIPKIINVQCACNRGGLRTSSGFDYAEAMAEARELARFENEQG